MAHQIMLEEVFDPNYEPNPEGRLRAAVVVVYVLVVCWPFFFVSPPPPDVADYASEIGLDLTAHPDLVWIAREGLKAPLPQNWKPWSVSSVFEWWLSCVW